MTRFQPDPSLSYPGYLFTANPDYQIQRLISATQAASSASPDITLLSSDGSLIETSKLLLSLYSPFLSSLLSSVPIHSCMHTFITLPDCSTASLNNLISLLTNGRGVSRHVGSDYRPASDVIDTGNLLGVRFGSLDYEVAKDSRRETVKKNQNIESNKEPFARVNQSIESSNVEDTDFEAKTDHSVTVSKVLQRNKINQCQTFEQSNGENNNVIEQQNGPNKIDQDETLNKNSFQVDEKKDTMKGHCEKIQNQMERDSSKSSIDQLSSIKSRATQENKSPLLEWDLICSSKMSSLNTTEDKSNYPCQCDTCGRMCKSKHGLQLHMRCHLFKPATGLIFACSTCGKLFKSRRGWQTHERGHGAEVIFTCSTCGKLFKSRKGWQTHERAHGAENWENFVKKDSPVQHETEGIKESSSTPILKNKLSKTKKRKNRALENKTSKSTLKQMKSESEEKSFVPSGYQKDETEQSKVCVKDKDILNKKYGLNKLSTKHVLSNDRTNNNITKTKIQKETTNTTMENENVIKPCSTKNKTSRYVSKRSRSSFGGSDNYEVPKAKIRERTASRSCLKKQPNLSTMDLVKSSEGIFKNLEDEAEGIFKNLEDEKFRRNLITQISQSAHINSFEGDDSSDKNTSKNFQDSKRYKKKKIGREKSAKADRLPLSSPRKCESPVRGRPRESRQKSLITDEDHLDYEWEDDYKISSEDEDTSPVRSPSESPETSSEPRTASQVNSGSTDNGSVPYLLANSQSTPISEEGNFFPSSNEFSDIDTRQFQEQDQSFDLDLFQ